MKINKILLISLTIIIFALMVTACSGGATDSMAVTTAAVANQKIEVVQDVTGVLVPSQTVDVQSKVSGQVTAVNSKVGSKVKKGDILVTLETDTLNIQLDQAKANLQAAIAAKSTAEGQSQQAKINLEAAQNNYQRIKELYDVDAVSQSELEAAQDKLSIAEAQYQSAQTASSSQSQASIDAAQATVDNINNQINEATVISPIDGVVTNLNINTGEIASAGSVLLTVIDDSSLKLKTTVAQETLPYITPGQEIRLTVDIYPGQEFTGTIDSIGPMAVSTGLYFPLEISIPNDGTLQAGLSAHALVNMSSGNGLSVPTSAVKVDNGQSYVFVIEDNTAVKRTVVTGLENDEQIQILKGLSAGDIIATDNINNLFDNMTVTVVSQ